MAVERRTVVLGAAVAVVVVVAAIVWATGGSSSPSTATTRRAPTPPSGKKDDAAEQPPPRVNLDSLKVARGEPTEDARNPFRFEARPAPAARGEISAPKPAVPVAPVPVVPPAPAGPPPPPPIPLKFIGIVTQGTTRVAVLTDGRSSPQSGKEGDIILGQYRIIRIGNESIEMSYLDGRGRTTIRLTGQ